MFEYKRHANVPENNTTLNADNLLYGISVFNLNPSIKWIGSIIKFNFWNF